MSVNTLLIVESPGKIKKLKAILGPGYEVMASIGHIRDLPQHDIGVDPPDFRPRYVLTDRGKEVATKLKDAAARANRVLLASDPDREGEAIAWHVAAVLRLKTIDRVVFHAIEPEEIARGLREIRPLDKNLVAAQEARRIVDRLIGYMVSGPLADRIGQPGLSAGRVQSPAVRLIVEREAAIAAFGSVKHFAVGLAFAAPAGTWWAWWRDADYRTKDQRYMTDHALAERIAAVRDVVVTDQSEATQDVPPPPPFTTTTMQKAAQAQHRLKPKAAMEAAQRLYEQGAITYHRTDAPNLSPEGFTALAAWAAANGVPVLADQRFWKARESAQEAHEAIRPTHWEETTAGETPAEQAVYQMIRQRAIASQMPPARWHTRSVTLEATIMVDGHKPVFVAQHRKLVEEGWKQLQDPAEREREDARAARTSGDAAESASETEDEVPAAPTGKGSDGIEDPRRNPLPEAMTPGQSLSASASAIREHATRPPPRFKQATLVEEMERLGIGRPSTYAAIMDNITRRNYVAEDGKGRLTPTELGARLVHELVPSHRFINLEYTRNLEEHLDQVALGRSGFVDVVSQVHAAVLADNAPWTQALPKCPNCGKPLRRRQNSRDQSWFWSCSGYPDCRTTLPDVNGQPGAARAAAPVDPKAPVHACPSCGKPMRRRQNSRDQSWFWSCSGYPKCKTTLPDANGQPGRPTPRK